MFSASLNDKTLSVIQDGSLVGVDGKTIDWQLSGVGERHYHIIWNNKCYRIEVVSVADGSKVVTLKVNGKRCDVTLRDRMDLLLLQMGLNNNSTGKVNSIKAPMPGLILEINAQQGDVVSPGDTLLVLEAMKMENVIKASGEGTVKSVRVSKGQSVEKGQVLIEF
jgi:acetyl/propionyl-CoA carboxylase alpha subunit